MPTMEKMMSGANQGCLVILYGATKEFSLRQNISGQKVTFSFPKKSLIAVGHGILL